MDNRILAKALTPESRSNAIVVPFGWDCYESVRGKRFNAVIRKMVPVKSEPRCLYLHINWPKSAICARAEIRSLGSVSRPKAIEMSQELDLSEERIRHYLDERQSVGCYMLGRIQLPVREVGTKEIAECMVYHPPQSFLVLSKEGKCLLDRMCGFPES